MDSNLKRRTIDLSNPEEEVRNKWWKEGWYTQRQHTGEAWWQHHKMRQGWRELRAVQRVVTRLLYEAARDRDILMSEMRR